LNAKRIKVEKTLSFKAEPIGLDKLKVRRVIEKGYLRAKKIPIAQQ